MKHLVRIFAMLLIASMAFSLVACSTEEKDTGKPTSGESLDFGSGSEDQSADGSEEGTEDESEGPTYNFDDIDNPTLPNPTVNAFVVPSTSSLRLSTAAAPSAEDCNVVTMTAADVFKGSLILVNSKYSLQADPEDLGILKNVYENRAHVNNTSAYKMPGTAPLLNEEALIAFNAMMTAYYNAMSNNYILLAETYRSYEAQSEIFQDALTRYAPEKVSQYAMKPNNSDFRTGYSVNLKYMPADGKTYSLFTADEAESAAAEIVKIADDYGFIQRYPSAKNAYTGLAKDVLPSLYRYVGVPHARVMNDGGYCLEEYIVGIKNYTENNRLKIEDGAHTYHVFYVPAEADGSTDIRIPKNMSEDQYVISGNNVDGFIVTITIQ